MHLAPETVSLKNGKTAVFRAAEPDDAPEMIAFLKDTAGETPFLLRYPDEVNFTEEGERSLLQSRSDDPSVVMLNAWVGGSWRATARSRPRARGGRSVTGPTYPSPFGKRTGAWDWARRC